VREKLRRQEPRQRREQDRQRHLKWAFSEAAVLFIAKSEQGRTVLKRLERLERKYGKPKALSVLAHKLGRAVYYMLARKQAFDPQRFATS
jgi:hypothetical protein